MAVVFSQYFDSGPDHLGLLSLGTAIPPPLEGKENIMAKTTKTKPHAATAPRQSKKATIIAMLERKNGATIAELVGATGWLGDSIRGAMSLLKSEDRLKIMSAKTADERRYFIRAGKASKK